MDAQSNGNNHTGIVSAEQRKCIFSNSKVLLLLLKVWMYSNYSPTPVTLLWYQSRVYQRPQTPVMGLYLSTDLGEFLTGYKPINSHARNGPTMPTSQQRG